MVGKTGGIHSGSPLEPLLVDELDADDDEDAPLLLELLPPLAEPLELVELAGAGSSLPPQAASARGGRRTRARRGRARFIRNFPA